jgi:hypothetical protein
MDPIGMAASKRQVDDEFSALKVDAERERQLDAIVAQARRMRPRRRTAAPVATKVANLPDLGPAISPLQKQPMSASPSSMAPPVPPIPPGPSPAATPMKQATPPAAPAPALPDPAHVTTSPPMTPNPAGMTMPPPAAPPPMGAPAPAAPPQPSMAPSAPPALPKAAPLTAMPGEADSGSMPRMGTPADSPAAAPPMQGAPDPFPHSPSSSMFYNLAGSLGGDAGRNFVAGLPQWAQQYGLPVGGGLASLLGLYLLSRFMGGGQQKMGETAKILHDMHGAEAWESAGGEAPKIKMSKTIMTTDPTAC